MLRWTTLLVLLRARPLVILCIGISFLRPSLLSALRRCRRSVRSLLLIVLSHYGVMRLITIILTVKRLLLLGPRIPGPRILSLVNR